jgi:hypothetical protein
MIRHGTRHYQDGGSSFQRRMNFSSESIVNFRPTVEPNCRRVVQAINCFMLTPQKDQTRKPSAHEKTTDYLRRPAGPRGTLYPHEWRVFTPPRSEARGPAVYLG